MDGEGSMEIVDIEVMQESLRKNIDGKNVGYDAGLVSFWMAEIALQLVRQNKLLERKFAEQ